MQRMQRRVGKFLPRSADEAQVGAAIREFQEADKMLEDLIAASKAWRDAWTDILRTQLATVEEIHSMYKPIIGASENSYQSEAVETPDDKMQSAENLLKEYTQLKEEMAEEVELMNSQIIQPATDARLYIKPMHKVIKKREDRKLDFERYKGRTDSSRKKTTRSDRENNALAKHERDLERSTEEYHRADEHLKANLPGVTEAAFSLLPHLLAMQIMIQNTMLGQLYTSLFNFSGANGFPTPPPPVDTIISTWEADFMPVKEQMESFNCLVRGKAAHQPFGSRGRTPTYGSTLTTTRSADTRRPTSNTRSVSTTSLQRSRTTPSPGPAPTPSPDPPAVNLSSKPKPAVTPKPQINNNLARVPTAFTSEGHNHSARDLSASTTNYTSPIANDAHFPAAPKADYFTRDRRTSNSTSTTNNTTTSPSPGTPGGIGALAAQVAAKKEPAPPPPPPPPQQPSAQSQWVTALYDYTGNRGELTFKEGDRIKVIERTESTNDWWEGEFRGKQGAFPANYVQVG